MAEGDDTSRCVRLQYEVAAGQHVPIYQWRSRSLDVEAVANENHRALLLGSDVQVSSLEEFKALLVDRAQAPPARVVVSRDKDADDQLARQVLATVREMTFTRGRRWDYRSAGPPGTKTSQLRGADLRPWVCADRASSKSL